MAEPMTSSLHGKNTMKKKPMRTRRTPKVNRADNPSAAWAGADWTVAPGGRSNASKAYLCLVDDIDRLLRECGFYLVNGQVRQVARLIVARLAHKHGLAPRSSR